jgi:segregation and condensation protein B
MIEKARDLPPAEDSGSRADDGELADDLPGARARAGLPLDEAAALAAVEAAGEELGGAGEELAGELGPAAREPSRLPLGHRIEALLFASGQALTPQRLANVLGAETDAVTAALAALLAAWRERAGAVELVEIAGGYRFMTRADYHADVAGLRGKVSAERLSPAALETLAVVAYRQPIGRAEVEGVRGVQVGPVLRQLLERDLIRVTGRSSEPGHPLLYGTTKRFLDHFGLKSLKALPDLKDLLETP